MITVKGARPAIQISRPEPRSAAASSALRRLLAAPRPEYLLEAHNAMSALLVEEAGFAGIWASSLTLSCSHGVRDNNELSMTQVLDVLETMTECTSIPILFDGDTGYGGFNHFQLLVRKLCARAVAGVCIEDKVFPKVNSFLRPESQPLVPVEEFCGKLRAGKDAQGHEEFVVVARTEALITGLGMDEALRRATRYAEAGADAVLVHSRASTFAEVAEFMARWTHPVPVVVVPTSYYGTGPESFAAAGVSVVIWANQMLRASLQAMRRTAAVLRESNTARDVEDEIAPLRAVFALQREDAKARAEDRYLAGPGLRCVILAASQGSELGELTRELPKCMVPVGGRPLLDKLLAQLRGEGVRDLVLVRGHGRERVAPEGVTLRDNDAWESTGELASLAAARDLLTGDTLVSYGDILIKRYILHELLACTAELAVVVDGSRSFEGSARPADRVRVSAPAPHVYEEAEFRLLEVRAELPDHQADGEWIGLLYARGAGAALLREGLDEIIASPAGRTAGMETLLNWLAARAPVQVLYVHGDWIDIDRLADLGRASLVQELHAG